MFASLDDTIVAISSPAGSGVRGVLRLSGPQAISLAAQVFRPEGGSLEEAPGHRRRFGRIQLEPGLELPGEAYVFRAPRSYTRQDVVELHTTGSPPILADLLDVLIRAGARLAEAGEFTARAYFNGAIDLTQAEGVAAVIHARSDAQLRASEALLHGRLARRTHELRERLADLLALVEAEIDFVEEPIDFIAPAEIARTVDAVAAEIGELLEHAPQVERLDVLPEVMLVGRPNAGKSTLFNRLTGADRAIQSAVAGTTRDVIRAPVTLERGEIMLADSAGVEASDGAEQADADGVAGLAQEATRRRLASADLLLVVLDATADPQAAWTLLAKDLPPRPVIRVLNKMDAVGDDRVEFFRNSPKNVISTVELSAATGDGVDALRAALDAALLAGAETHGTDVLALTHRQRSALEDARAALARAADICTEVRETASCAELIAIEVRDAMHALSLLTGAVTTEDLLGRIFSRFCIGK